MSISLKKFRKMAGLTQPELAAKIEKSVRTIQMWEKGAAYPPADKVWDMCEILGCDPNSLLGWESETFNLSAEERELVENYRASTPQWRTNISMTARSAAGESKEVSEAALYAEQMEEIEADI